MSASSVSAKAGPRPAAERALVVLLALGAVGSAVMTAAHLGMPLPEAFGFGPGRVIVPAAIGFVVGTVLYAIAWVGVQRRTSWCWLVALAVNALALTTATVQYRGLGSLSAIVVSIAVLIVLLTPSGRRLRSERRQ